MDGAPKRFGYAQSFQDETNLEWVGRENGGSAWEELGRMSWKRWGGYFRYSVEKRELFPLNALTAGHFFPVSFWEICM
jgi:hypothetical protein